MGNPNQEIFVRDHRDCVDGPILEIGSKDYGSAPDLRLLFPGCDYIGLDMNPGKGVDVVVDLTWPFEAVDHALGGRRFRTVFCFSVLEHCQDPFRMAENITGLVESGGALFVSVPFAWELHDFPSDYWRFTPDGVKVLFSGFDFSVHPGCIATPKRGDMRPIDEGMYGIPTKVSLRRGQFMQAGFFHGLFLYFCAKLRAYPPLFGTEKLFPMVMINMIGVKLFQGAR